MYTTLREAINYSRTINLRQVDQEVLGSNGLLQSSDLAIMAHGSGSDLAPSLHMHG